MLCGDDLFNEGVFCDFTWLETIAMWHDGVNYLSRVELCANLVDALEFVVSQIKSLVLNKRSLVTSANVGRWGTFIIF